MGKKIDITDAVDFSPGNIDGDLLPITKCICGQEFELWDFSIWNFEHSECPSCNRKLHFEVSVRIYETQE
jgi:hypothetical protein